MGTMGMGTVELIGMGMGKTKKTMEGLNMIQEVQILRFSFQILGAHGYWSSAGS